MNAFFLMFFLPPIIIGILVTAFLLIALIRVNKKSRLSLRNYAVGFGVCVAANIFAIVISMGFLGAQSYIILCGPLMIFGFILTKQLIKSTPLNNLIINFIYKSIAIVLIWFMAFFPFSLFGIGKIANLPKESAEKQEILRIQDEILKYETYADLTPFGLGLYKLQHKGGKILWDVTKPEDHVIEYEGVEMVYESHYNRRDEESWDDAWGNSNRGKDVMYDVYCYDGIYLIVTPLWEKPGGMYYWGYIYLCEELDKDVDLFDIGILDPKVVKNFKELPVERISRKELSEKLGKEY